MYKTCFRFTLVLSLILSLLACSTVKEVLDFGDDENVALYDHVADVESWKQRREESLRKPYGWLSLVGLFWLEPGENRIGSSIDNDIILKAGPARWGVISVDGDTVRFKAHSEVVKVSGELVADVELIADVDGEPNIVTAGSTQFYLIKRGSYALRVKDSQSPVLVNFAGLDYYPVDESWRIEGKFIPAKEGEVIQISNVLGQLEGSKLAGTVEFERGDRTYRLAALDEDDRLFFLFADRTNGSGTYGAGRFIYTELPKDGRVIIDFNKAYNPPCAFTDYSTCPLPPPQNRLPVEVLAGEKEYNQY